MLIGLCSWPQGESRGSGSGNWDITFPKWWIRARRTLRCGFQNQAELSNFWGGIDRGIDWPQGKDHFDTKITVHGGWSWEIDPGWVTVPQGDSADTLLLLLPPSLISLLSDSSVPFSFLSSFLHFSPLFLLCFPSAPPIFPYFNPSLTRGMTILNSRNMKFSRK
ncbi:hypothetical protein ACFXTO_022022 [Malus domestica]